MSSGPGLPLTVFNLKHSKCLKIAFFVFSTEHLSVGDITSDVQPRACVGAKSRQRTDCTLDLCASDKGGVQLYGSSYWPGGRKAVDPLKVHEIVYSLKLARSP